MTKVLRPTVANAVGASVDEIKAEGLAVNRAEGPAYKSGDEQALVTYLTTGGVGNTYYADKQTLNDEASRYFKQFALRDPRFLAQAAIYARERGLMRSAPITALVHLSTGGSEAKRMFHAAFPRIIQTPGDLQDLWKLVRGPQKIRGVGRSIRTETNNWLAHLNAYGAIKYGSTSQAFALRDIYRLSRGATFTGEAAAIAHYLTKGELTEDAPAQLRGYHEFKNATADIDTLMKLVGEHRLPWEVVASQVGDGDSAERTKVWGTMAINMPYMALLRNLSNLLKYGVLQDQTMRTMVCARLASAEAVAKSKQLPFRFISAIRAVEGHRETAGGGVLADVIDALKRALNLSVANFPVGLGHTLAVLDVSGSMSASISTGHSHGRAANSEPLRYVDIGAIFAASVFKGAEGGDIMTFDTEARYERGLSADMGVYDIATRINHSGGGTALSVPIQMALSAETKYDTMVFITDSESWVDEMSGRGSEYSWGYRHLGETKSNALLRAYREKVNSKMQAFFLQLCPTGTQMTAPDLAGTYYISGWSNSVLDYILFHAAGNGQLDAIRAIDL